MNEIKIIKNHLDNILIIADTVGGFYGVMLTMQVSSILKELEEIEQDYEFVLDRNEKLLDEIRELVGRG